MQEPKAAIVERLEEQHRFPGPFMFKAIGPNTETFRAEVTQAVVVVLGAQTELQVISKESSGGNHVAVTLMAQVQAAAEVLDIWALMGKISGIKMVL